MLRTSSVGSSAPAALLRPPHLRNARKRATAWTLPILAVVLATGSGVSGCVEDPGLGHGPAAPGSDTRRIRKDAPPLMPCQPHQPSQLAGCGDDYPAWTCADLGYKDAEGVQPGCDLTYETAVDGLLCAWDVRPCEAAPCGNGVVQPALAETCDDGGATLAGCPYGEVEACSRCDESCQWVDDEPARFCGDGVLDPEEVCEVGTSTACDYGYLQDDLMHCLPDCGGWDRTSCRPSVCGDSVHSLSEECDPPASEIPTCDYGDEDCPWAGTAYCSADCTLEDVALRRCGDGIVEEHAEDCEPGDRREVVCRDGMPTVQHCSDLCGWAPLSCKGEDVGVHHFEDEWMCDTAHYDDDVWSGQCVADARGTRGEAGPDVWSEVGCSDSYGHESRRIPEDPVDQGCRAAGSGPAIGGGWLLLMALVLRRPRRRSAKRGGVGVLVAAALLVGCVEDPEQLQAPSEDVLDARVMRKESPGVEDDIREPCRVLPTSSIENCGEDYERWTCVDLGFRTAREVRPSCVLDARLFGEACPWDLTPCETAPCGNGVVEPEFDEACDDGAATLDACPYGDDMPCSRCDETCQVLENQPPRFCGDGELDAEEVCEVGTSRPCDFGYLQEDDMHCLSDCTDWDRSTCRPAVCGDGIVSVSEECEPPAAEVPTCEYGRGQCPPWRAEYCSDTCQNARVATRFCGDGVLELAFEVCEPGDTQEARCPNRTRTTQRCSYTCDWLPPDCGGPEPVETDASRPPPDSVEEADSAATSDTTLATDATSDAADTGGTTPPEPDRRGNDGCAAATPSPGSAFGWLLLLAAGVGRRRACGWALPTLSLCLATSTLAGGCVEDPELRNAPSEDVLDARVMRKETPPWEPCEWHRPSNLHHCGQDYTSWTCVDLGYPDAIGVRPGCDLDYTSPGGFSSCPWDLSPCEAAPCGNGVLQPALGEACDDGGATLEACAYGDPAPCESCDANCQIVVREVGRTCGDGVRDDEEACERGESRSCGWGFLPGTRETCRTNCHGWDASACQPVVCGDGIISSPEQCDPPTSVPACAYGDAACAAEYCTTNCQLSQSPTSWCGDGYVDDAHEECEIGHEQVVQCGSGVTVTSTCGDDCRWQHQECPRPPDRSADEVGGGCSSSATGTPTPWLLLSALGIGRLRTRQKRRLQAWALPILTVALGTSGIGSGCVEDPELRHAPSEDVGLDERATAKSPPPTCTVESWSSLVSCGEDYEAWTCVELGFPDAIGVRPKCDLEAQSYDRRPCEWDTTPCEAPACGNGVVQPHLGEECDDRRTTLFACPYRVDAPCDTCDENCQLARSNNVRGCGDGVHDPEEKCELGDTRPCVTGYMLGDDIVCMDDCRDWDLSACRPAVCGDGIITAPENCEPPTAPVVCAYGDKDCEPTTYCSENCRLVTTQPRWCGDGWLDRPEEECDPGWGPAPPCAEGQVQRGVCGFDCRIKWRDCSAALDAGGCTTTATTLPTPWLMLLVAIGIGRLRTRQRRPRESTSAAAG